MVHATSTRKSVDGESEALKCGHSAGGDRCNFLSFQCWSSPSLEIDIEVSFRESVKRITLSFYDAVFRNIIEVCVT